MSSVDHATWLASSMKITPTTIWVDSPEEKGSGFSKFVDYAVCQPSKSVRHRYSDFEKLHATLKARYGNFGLLVPSLPKKNVVIKGVGFHFQRMRGLQMFCEKVASNPYLREDKAWLDFLEDGKPVVVEKDPFPSPPLRWMQAVEETDTPSNAGEMIAGFKTESVRCEKHLHDMISKFRSCITAISNLTLTVTDVATSAVNFSESETSDVEFMNTLSKEELSSGAATSSPPNVMARMSTLFSSQVSALSNTPDALNLLLVEALDYEGSQMSEFNAMSKHVDKLASLNDSNERTLNNLRNKNTAKMTEEKVAKHNEAIELAEKTLKASKEHLDKYIRALTMITLPILVTERRERIRLLSLHLGAVTKAVSSYTLSATDAFFESMNVEDSNDYVDSASMILEALSLPPLPESKVRGGSAVRVKSNSIQAERTSVSANQESQTPPPPPGGAIHSQEV